MIELVSDTHRELDIQKVFDHASKYEMTKKNNIIIILGDFGLLWDGSPSEIRLRQNLNNRPFTTLWLSGNHENFDMIESYKISEMFGGKVRIILNSIIQLMTGEVYEIEGKKIFVFGGALSIDQHLRLPGRSWWDKEIPSIVEFNNAISNLDKHNWKVDFVLTHTAPYNEVESFTNGPMYKTDPTTLMLQEIKDKLDFKHWAFGHFHTDKNIGRFTCIYRKIINIYNLGKDSK